ncbi:SufE family protein [Sanguibacter antarcticus]|uniref:Cysteine desulfuration protein SufE n=1 Tax=Sanguibacter antarcticus TaxID=372484 RepID=A0A2A9E2V6_9MICO|nr:SufE family protein [Sanguibacter antarcticus]PFG32986.1 cysteine desulfuration protein SufE [Sanguibacter antarcticus]
MSITTSASSQPAADLPAALAGLVEELRALAPAQRLEMLVEMGASVAEVPEPYASDTSLMERVQECQSPVFVAAEVAPVAPHAVTVHYSAPDEAPTTRGFAGILTEGLADLDAGAVLAVPSDLPVRLGFGGLISPLRLAGMSSMLGRVQRQVRDAVAAVPAP